MTQRILGVDPGLNITGYGVIEITSGKLRLVEAGVIRCKSRGELSQRVRVIFEGLTEVIEALDPTSMGLEDIYSHYQRPKTAILMGHARGVLCLAAAQADVPVFSYAATQVKRMLTGSGRAPKVQMQEAIRRELRLDTVPEPDDVADALAVALCHYHMQKTAALSN